MVPLSDPVQTKRKENRWVPFQLNNYIQCYGKKPNLEIYSVLEKMLNVRRKPGCQLLNQFSWIGQISTKLWYFSLIEFLSPSFRMTAPEGLGQRQLKTFDPKTFGNS